MGKLAPDSIRTVAISKKGFTFFYLETVIALICLSEILKTMSIVTFVTVFTCTSQFEIFTKLRSIFQPLLRIRCISKSIISFCWIWWGVISLSRGFKVTNGVFLLVYLDIGNVFVVLLWLTWHFYNLNSWQFLYKKCDWYNIERINNRMLYLEWEIGRASCRERV